jgi:uncharacterized protein (TIGR03435 family)
MQYTPDGFYAENTPLRLLVQEAYGVKDDQISGLPDWAKIENYDLYAKVNSADVRKCSPVPKTARGQPRLRLILPVHQSSLRFKNS